MLFKLNHVTCGIKPCQLLVFPISSSEGIFTRKDILQSEKMSQARQQFGPVPRSKVPHCLGRDWKRSFFPVLLGITPRLPEFLKLSFWERKVHTWLPNPNTHRHTPIPGNFSTTSLVTKNPRAGVMWRHAQQNHISAVFSVGFVLLKSKARERPHKWNVGDISVALICKSSNGILNAKACKPIATAQSFPCKVGRVASWDNTKVFLAVRIDFLSLEATIFYYNPKTTNEKTQLWQHLI